MSRNPNRCNMSHEFCERNDCKNMQHPEDRYACALDRMSLTPPPPEEQSRTAFDAYLRESEVNAMSVGGAIRGKPEPGAWLASLSSAERKECAVSRGFMAYFPDAMALVARHSVRMNEKHNPGEPVHWARGKSTDQPDCEARHLIATSVDPDARDADGAYEIICKAWRSMADLQEWAERKFNRDGRID